MQSTLPGRQARDGYAPVNVAGEDNQLESLRRRFPSREIVVRMLPTRVGFARPALERVQSDLGGTLRMMRGRCGFGSPGSSVCRGGIDCRKSIPRSLTLDRGLLPHLPLIIRKAPAPVPNLNSMPLFGSGVVISAEEFTCDRKPVIGRATLRRFIRSRRPPWPTSLPGSISPLTPSSYATSLGP